MKRLALLLALGAALCAPLPAGAMATVGTVEGTVTPVEWAQEVEVCVVESPSETCAVPRADGSYAFSGLPTGVRLQFIPSYRSGLLTQYYDHVGELKEATPIVIPQPPARAENIDGDLIEGGAIKGSVSAESDGVRLPDVEVCAVSAGASPTRVCGETGAGGEYELHSLPTGSYQVAFYGEGESAGYQPRLYPVSIRVGAGEVVSGIDVGLAGGARIEGVVTAAADDRRLEGIAVCLFRLADSTATRCTRSGGGGAYVFEGLPDDSYQVGFSLGTVEIAGAGTAAEAEGFEPQYYDGVVTRAQAATIPLFAAETVGGIDAALSARATTLVPPPALGVSNQIVAAAPTVAQPKPKKVGCRKPRQKKKVRGKVRCVRTSKREHSRHHKSKKIRQKHRGDKR